jgi:hypothetical protein
MKVDPSRSQVAIYTYAEGLCSALAHDLELGVKTIMGEATRGEPPAVEITIAVASIGVVGVVKRGKVDRNALSMPAQAAPIMHSLSRQQPRTTTERTVAALWCELLEIEEVGLLDNFLDLGGHSLLVMRAVALLQARTGASLSPRAFVFQTLEQIAAECDAAVQISEPVEESRGLLKRVIARFGRAAQK